MSWDELEKEPLGDVLINHIDNIAQSNKEWESSISEFCNRPSRYTQNTIFESMGVVVDEVDDAMTYVLDSRQYDLDEKIAFLSSILSHDDSRRVDFLNELTISDIFIKCYPDHDTNKDDIARKLDYIIDTEEEPHEVLKAFLIQTHVAKMVADMNHLIEDEDIQEKLKNSEKRVAIARQAVKLGAVALAAAAGSAISNLFFKG